MEALYLLGSILYTFLTSITLSLFIPLRYLFTLLRSSKSAKNDLEAVSLYEGTVWHERRRPVRHSFRYAVRYALFDLDRAPNVPPDHLSADDARRMADTSGPVLLLTVPPSLGYEQNPLSLYYCYNLEGSIQHLKKCIAEVTNTPWGERVTFLFNPDSDLVAKSLHVSPFMDMHGSWRMRATAPGDNLFVSISVQHPSLGDYFVATLRAKRVPSSLTSDHTIFFYLMPHKVALWIYWHAFKLWWNNVAFIQHPRYTNTAYREEAFARDRDLKCCQAFSGEKDQHLQAKCDTGCLADGSVWNRQFRWRDANWPWC
ncbi:hypothetical protein HS088_TW13G01216 [Tripterygium wilfordii]|uniref:Uncharacterized protein n=1 Tax=Tripterygium wilfordii TaxID=458696 RepID=A0A7J7CW53_TRIWF|nr:uncharacterized protein LOC120012281 [Tripterygium wilfordii]XP_038719556.1 uncharacterized protein LOC120012281 [Tripterygium wilfordii]KAF5738320.1 hypothetical protein HS088_TW13G01216 [Tripterygium wilfordii]